MVKIGVLLLVMLLASCENIFPKLEKTEEVSIRTIIWERHRPHSCGDVVNQKNGVALHGCATIHHAINTCVIEVEEDASNELGWHEFKHCFGYSHKD